MGIKESFCIEENLKNNILSYNHNNDFTLNYELEDYISIEQKNAINTCLFKNIDINRWSWYR